MASVTAKGGQSGWSSAPRAIAAGMASGAGRVGEEEGLPPSRCRLQRQAPSTRCPQGQSRQPQPRRVPPPHDQIPSHPSRQTRSIGRAGGGESRARGSRRPIRSPTSSIQTAAGRGEAGETPGHAASHPRQSQLGGVPSSLRGVGLGGGGLGAGDEARDIGVGAATTLESNATGRTGEGRKGAAEPGGSEANGSGATKGVRGVGEADAAASRVGGSGEIRWRTDAASRRPSRRDRRPSASGKATLAQPPFSSLSTSARSDALLPLFHYSIALLFGFPGSWNRCSLYIDNFFQLPGISHLYDSRDEDDCLPCDLLTWRRTDCSPNVRAEIL